MNATEVKRIVEATLELFMDGLITAQDAANETFKAYMDYSPERQS